jgi:hypothetical protein
MLSGMGSLFPSDGDAYSRMFKIHFERQLERASPVDRQNVAARCYAYRSWDDATLTSARHKPAV